GFEWRYLFRLCRGNYSAALPKHEQVLGSMEFSPNGRLLATYCWDGKLRLWDLENSSTRPIYEAANATGLGGFSAEGNGLIFGGRNGVIQVYDVMTERVTNAVACSGEIIAYSARANVIATIAPDRQIKVWELGSSQPRFSLPGIQRYLEFG